MHWADINAALYKCGWPPGKVAKHLGKATPSISCVIRGTITSYNIASFISAKTNIPLNKLWPDGRYASPRKSGSKAA